MNKISNLINYLTDNGFKKEAAFLTKLSQDGQNRIHIIRGGDSPSALADKYEVATEDIMKLNGLKLVQKKDKSGNVVLNSRGEPILVVKPHLVPGKKLIIPPAQISFNSVQTPSNKLVEWMKYEEGGNGSRPSKYRCNLPVPGRGEPYLCSYDDGKGNLTIGWGRNQKNQNHQIIEDVAILERLLREDIAEAARHLSSSIEGVDETKLTIPVALNQHQFDALTSLIFNSGRGAFKDSDLYREYISKGRLGPELSSDFLNYRIGEKQGGLVGRRRRELAMFLRGEYNKKP